MEYRAFYKYCAYEYLITAILLPTRAPATFSHHETTINQHYQRTANVKKLPHGVRRPLTNAHAQKNVNVPPPRHHSHNCNITMYHVHCRLCTVLAV